MSGVADPSFYELGIFFTFAHIEERCSKRESRMKERGEGGGEERKEGNVGEGGRVNCTCHL